MQNTNTESNVQDVQMTLTDKIKDLEGVYLLDHIDGLELYQRTKRQISSVFLVYLIDSENGYPSEATKYDVWGLHDSFQAILDKLYLERQEEIFAPYKATMAATSEDNKH